MLLSLAALAGIGWAGWSQLKDAASLHRDWRLSWLLAAALMQSVVYVSIAAMFRICLRRYRSSLSNGFLTYCAFAFLFANRALPGPAVAGVATLVYLLRRKRIPAVDAQAAAGTFYFADYAGFFTMIAAVAVPLYAQRSNHATLIAYTAALTIIAVAAVTAVWLFTRPEPAIAAVSSLAALLQRQLRVPGELHNWGSIVSRWLLDLRKGLSASSEQPGDLCAYFLLSLVMHCSEVATVLCGARSAGIPLTWLVGGASYVAGNLASILSVLPGAVGFYEAGMAGTIHVAGGLSIGDSLVCALTYRLLSFWAPLPVVVNVLFQVTKENLAAAKRGGPANST